MATVKVKLRSSSVIGKAGTIFYQVTHSRKTLQITTNIHLKPDEWDAENVRILSSAPDRMMLRNRIDSDVSQLRKIINDLEKRGASYTTADIVQRFRNDEHQTSVLTFFRRQIELLRNANRLGTARNYEKTFNSFSQFLGSEDIRFSMMTEPLIENYNAFLVRRGIVRNSISFYMRILKAVYNKAVRQHLAEPGNPFQEVYTGIDRTRKRAIPESLIVQLYRLELPAESSLSFARDIFIFSYCTRGMAFVDVAYLKKANIHNGMIHYSRRKTGQLLSVRIEDNIQTIIDKYRTDEREYIFPIISSEDTAEAYEQYRQALNNYNRHLKMLSRLLPEGNKLTSYTSRHSWATVARDHNVPISVISAGLGHTSEQTTQIYLTMLENSVIDEANQGIISSLNE